MGHLVGKELYRRLGRKIDGLGMRAPWNDALYSILKALYSADDAELVVAMPYGLSPLERVERVTGIPRLELERRLDSLSSRGLVLDLCVDGRTYYAPSPMVIGIFEFTMMRTRGDLRFAEWAGLFHDYMEEGSFLEANFGDRRRVPIMRALPHEGSVRPDDAVEVLDYERATAIVEGGDRFAVGVCSCRHEKEHLGERTCTTPLDNCSTFGAVAVDYVVRHGFAREVSRSEMLENIARSRELGLVLNADNVQRNVTFICHCCGCCCNVLRGISRHGCPHAVVTSSFIAGFDRDTCTACGTCSKRCPIEAIARVEDPDPRFRRNGKPQVDESICLGCGVCTLTCKPGSMRLHPRPQRVLHPESTFARAILQCLDRGTLQNQLFDDPRSTTQAFLRGLVGGFLRLPPVKRALMSDLLRSRFLAAMTRGVAAQGGSALTEL